MRRRPPVTLVAYMASIAVILLAGVTSEGADAEELLPLGVLLGTGVAGVYFRIRLVWIVFTALQAGSLLYAVTLQRGGGPIALAIALLALLLADPSRRYFRQEPRAASERVSRTGRTGKLVAVVLAGLLVVLVGNAVISRPDPVSGDIDLVRSPRSGLRVLFVGNNLTADNSMTTIVRRLAESDRQAAPIFAVQYARRGSTLEDALEDRKLRDLLAGERWDHVVLQEHSQAISRGNYREARTFPAAFALESLSRRSGAQTLLFASWGYREGDEDAVPDDTYGAMQSRVSRAYFELASRLPAVMAPVGLAWEAALRRQPQLKLWGDDGRRPSLAGSYLTACVLYSQLTHRDPTGSRFTAALDRAQAQSLQQIAKESVLQMYPEALRRQ